MAANSIRVVARVTGNLALNLHPLPGNDSIWMVPLRFSMFASTTLRPTPLPDTSVINELVENPGRKMSD